MKFFFIVIINIYKLLISPFLMSSCRFYPTCSDYINDAVIKYNVVFAFYLSVVRILKCNGFLKGGYNPVL